MRTAFLTALEELAAEDSRICLVVGDLGYSVIERFAERFPLQFVNAGVAEQNMTGLAAGMALAGSVVFTYSIANFSTLRCLEQIRNDVCYERANVRVVAVGGGLAYGSLGPSHHATEDLAIMRCLPGMTVVAPGDPVEASLATRALIDWPGPAYLRLGKAGEATVHQDKPSFVIGRAIRMREGDDLTLISTGGMLPTAAIAADRLAAAGIGVRLLSMHTLAPLDAAEVMSAAIETPHVVTLEEHGIRGGLGGAVAEVMAALRPARAPLTCLGLPTAFHSRAGDQSHLRQRYGLDADSVVASLTIIAKEKCGHPS